MEQQQQQELKMNKIKSVLESRKNYIKFPVKVGSRTLVLSINQDTRCKDLIRKALVECRIGATGGQQINSKDYVLFERSRGVERLLARDKNLFELILTWDLCEYYELVVKKSRKSQIILNSMIRNGRYGKRLFKKATAVLESAPATAADAMGGEIHHYEKLQNNSYEMDSSDKSLIDSSPSAPTGSDSKMDNFIERIFRNQKVLNEQNKQMIMIEKSISKHVLNVRKIVSNQSNLTNKDSGNAKLPVVSKRSNSCLLDNFIHTFILSSDV